MEAYLSADAAKPFDSISARPIVSCVKSTPIDPISRERGRMRISISYTCHAPLKDRKRKRQTLTFRDAAVTCRVTHAETIVAVSVASATAHSQKEGGREC